MDLSLIPTFLAVYRAGSFTAASTELHLSQPAVTTRIRALETQVGGLLFQRLPRGVEPTPMADELALEVADHIDALTAISERVAKPRDPFAKPVRIAGPTEFMSAVALPRLAPLIDQGLKLKVSFGLSDALLEALMSGEFDVVISTVPSRNRGVSTTPLFDEEFVLTAAPAWAARLSPEDLERDPFTALKNVPIVAFAEDLPIIRRYWRVVFNAPIRSRAMWILPDLRAILKALASGAGISVLPRYLCENELSTGELVQLLDPRSPPTNTLYFAIRRGTAERPSISAVREQLFRQC